MERPRSARGKIVGGSNNTAPSIVNGMLCGSCSPVTHQDSTPPSGAMKPGEHDCLLKFVANAPHMMDLPPWYVSKILHGPSEPPEPPAKDPRRIITSYVQATMMKPNNSDGKVGEATAPNASPRTNMVRQRTLELRQRIQHDITHKRSNSLELEGSVLGGLREPDQIKQRQRRVGSESQDDERNQFSIDMNRQLARRQTYATKRHTRPPVHPFSRSFTASMLARGHAPSYPALDRLFSDSQLQNIMNSRPPSQAASDVLVETPFDLKDNEFV